MFRTNVITNGESFPFFDYKEAFSYILSLTIKDSKFVSFDALRERLITSYDLIADFCKLKYESIEKGEESKALKRIANRMIKEKGDLARYRKKDNLVSHCCNLMMSIEGHGTLHGFGWASQKFGDVLPGNAEKTSVKG